MITDEPPVQQGPLDGGPGDPKGRRGRGPTPNGCFLNIAEILTDLSRAVVEMPVKDLPRLRGGLAEADSIALSRLVTEAHASGNEPQGAAQTPGGTGGVASRGSASSAPNIRFLTPKEAARVANVPTRRIYEWAHEASWAHRPTRRCLRIDETAFRQWLSRR
jgi:excisionase family DNA binding protein